jgi:hypothetical protein
MSATGSPRCSTTVVGESGCSAGAVVTEERADRQLDHDRECAARGVGVSAAVPRMHPARTRAAGRALSLTASRVDRDPDRGIERRTASMTTPVRCGSKAARGSRSHHNDLGLFRVATGQRQIGSFTKCAPDPLSISLINVESCRRVVRKHGGVSHALLPCNPCNAGPAVSPRSRLTSMTVARGSDKSCPSRRYCRRRASPSRFPACASR